MSLTIKEKVRDLKLSIGEPPIYRNLKDDCLIALLAGLLTRVL